MLTTGTIRCYPYEPLLEGCSHSNIVALWNGLLSVSSSPERPNFRKGLRRGPIS